MKLNEKEIFAKAERNYNKTITKEERSEKMIAKCIKIIAVIIALIALIALTVYLVFTYFSILLAFLCWVVMAI